MLSFLTKMSKFRKKILNLVLLNPSVSGRVSDPKMFVSDPDTLSQGFLIRILPDLKKVPDTVPDLVLHCKYSLFLYANDLYLTFLNSVAEPHHFYAAPAVLPYCIAKQNVENKLKFIHMIDLSSFHSVRFILLKMCTEWVINCYRYILCNFKFLTMINTIVGAGAGAVGAASRYGSSSDQMMRLLAASAPQHCF
jgi:hypothetical protein